MIKIEEFILLPLEVRQKHLRLDEPCVDRGGYKDNTLSQYVKGLLAYILDTTIPETRRIYACHACNNGKCSNPYHLYWGTPKENYDDAVRNGSTKTMWEHMVNKYGLEKAREIRRTQIKSIDFKGAGLGVPKTEEHKKNISKSITSVWKQKKGSIAQRIERLATNQEVESSSLSAPSTS